MHLSAGRVAASFITLSCLILLPWTGAQTLQQRTPAQPQAQAAEPAAPVPPVARQPVLAKGTSLQVEIERHYPMKAGETVEGRLMHPIFWDGKLAVPAQTLLRGRVVALEPNKKVRWQGRLNGDFTPYHTPEVRFDELVLPSGSLPISAPIADDGAPVLQLTAPGAMPRRSFIARHWDQATAQLHDRIAFFTAPGRGDRALQVLYHQLPYHPERIEAHTAWSFELEAPLALPGLPTSDPDPAPPARSPGVPETWSIHAQLAAGLTSATAQPGDPVQALVIEPVYDSTNHLVVPEGAVLIGKVTTAKPARGLGRNGKLRFAFQQVRMPAGAIPVAGSLAGASVEKSQNLSLDAEGTVTPRDKSSVIAPLLLTMLAGRALDTDGNMALKNGVSSNGFGLAGRLIGMAAGAPNLAAGLGYYAAGLSIYNNFLHSGLDVVFPRDTRIEILTTPLRAPVLTPEGQ